MIGDDTSVISASLYETYRGYLTEDKDNSDGKSAIRQSLKDVRKSNKKEANEGWSLQQHMGHQNINGHDQRQHPSDVSQSSDKTELESWIKSKGQALLSSDPGRSRSRNNDATDYKNITAISKASKHPYRVLCISQSASPREFLALTNVGWERRSNRGEQ